VTHWGWYWKIKKKHIPKPVCSNFMSIDSFSMFKNKMAVADCLNKVALEIPAFKLKATLLTDKYSVECELGFYSIPVEQQACNFGGYRYFFHCPKCNRRMRMLYCVEGVFICRKCINAGYVSQRRLASRRNLYKMDQVEKYLNLRGGSIYKKPKYMHWTTFYKLQDAHVDYQVKAEEFLFMELRTWYPRSPMNF